MTNEAGKGLQKVEGASGNLPTDTTIRLTQNEVLELTGLDATQIAELKNQHAAGVIELKKKADELKIDVAALDAALSSFSDQTAKATQAGAHATITHTQDSSLGRTEVVIGNTEKAASGKISRSGTGEQDRTLWIVGIVVVAAIVIALIVSG